MNESAIYNEVDNFAADWLENLIRAGHIAPGRVERRSIVDLTPDDLAGYRQVHLFAGIGIWSASLRDAGQRDDAPWWTASCPCPPFSAAGKKKSCPVCGGTNPVPHVGRTGYFVCCVCGHDWLADDRHLWPEVWRLTRDCRPAKLAGEQVASPDGQVWLSSVRASLEILGYGVGASDLCAPGVQVPAGETTIGRETIEWIRGAILACPDPQLAADLRDYAEWFEREVGIGAPHIRQRLFWMANTDSRQRDGIAGGEGSERDGTAPGRQQSDGEFECRSKAGCLADANGRNAGTEGLQRSGQYGQQPQDGCAVRMGISDSGGRPSREFAATPLGHGHSAIAASDVGELADSESNRRREERQNAGRFVAGDRAQGRTAGFMSSGATDILGHADNAGSQGRIERRNGRDERPARSAGMAFFSDADWILCTDGQARTVEVGTFPLAHGEPARVGKLRAYGNQIFRPLTTQFIFAAVEAIGDVA